MSVVELEVQKTDVKESESGDTHNGTDPQLEAAKEAGMTWNFEGKDYAKFVVNKTGSIGMPVFNPNDRSKQIGILTVDFAWENDNPFLDLVDYDIRDESIGRERQKTTSKMADLIQLSTTFFRDTMQRGFWIDVNDDGEQSEPAELTRGEILTDFTPEVHHTLVDLFTSRFYVERYYPSGPPKGRDLLKEPSEIFFKCSIGNVDHPAHVFIVQCDVPSPEARNKFRQDLAVRVNEQRGDTNIARVYINDSVKLKFIRKRIVDVQGCLFGTAGVLDPDTSTLYDVRKVNPESLKRFVENLNPDWMMKLCNELAGSFNYSEK